MCMTCIRLCAGGNEKMGMNMCTHAHTNLRVGAQLGLPHMITIEIKIPNRMVGLGK